MPGSAALSLQVRVTGVQGGSSLASQVYELSPRFTGSTTPTAVDTGYVTIAGEEEPLNWHTIDVDAIAGTLHGIIIEAVQGDIAVSCGGTEEEDIRIIEGEANFFSPKGTLKVQATATETEITYKYVAYGLAS